MSGSLLEMWGSIQLRLTARSRTHGGAIRWYRGVTAIDAARSSIRVAILPADHGNFVDQQNDGGR